MTDVERAERPVGLSVVSTTTDRIRVITLAGEIDQHTGQELRRALDVSGTVRPRIVIDLRQVTFMDSSGVNTLIAAHQDITAAGGWLRLAAPTRTVRRVLHLVGVDELIDCRDTLRQALSA
ncbi:STAS domain-containing protein [Streptomyces sp. NPDC085946]|uniref:STAS domain-containing protein n=1 Tax=Streptomyces sp. NPDC085946 TaxID=3365744 RepID=UPI0037D0FBBE